MREKKQREMEKPRDVITRGVALLIMELIVENG